MFDEASTESKMSGNFKDRVKIVTNSSLHLSKFCGFGRLPKSTFMDVSYPEYFYGYAAAAKLHQLCPTLCNPIDSSPPGSSVPGILQARILEWVAISFSNPRKWKVKVKSLSHVQRFAIP